MSNGAVFDFLPIGFLIEHNFFKIHERSDWVGLGQVGVERTVVGVRAEVTAVDSELFDSSEPVSLLFVSNVAFGWLAV